jgi:type I restriction enzyme S subunit
MKTVALGKVANIDRTVANSGECLSLPYVGLEHVEKESGHFADGFVPTPLNMLATNFRFTPKHVLYGKLRPYLNKVVLPNFDGVCTTEILPILPNEENLDRTFLWAVLLSPTFVNWATSQISGANLPRLDPKLLLEYEIPLPPLAEQKRIASLLARADRLRQLRRIARDLGDDLLQSVFLEMFGDPIINPNKYEKALLSDLEVKDGIKCGPFGTQLTKSEFKRSGVPLWGIKHVNKKFDFPTDEFLSPEKARQLKTYSLLPGDIVMTRKGTVGNCSIYPSGFPEGIMHSDLLRIRIDKKKINEIFLSAQLMFSHDVEHQISLISGGAVMEGINVGKLESIVVLVPPLSKQEEFAGVAARVESLRGRMGESTRQVEGLFESLLSQSFGG